MLFNFLSCCTYFFWVIACPCDFLQPIVPVDYGTVKCALVPIKELDFLQLLHLPISKREDFLEVAWFSTPAQILRARLTFAHAAAKRLADGEAWKTINGAVHVPHLKRYFESLLFERWLSLIDESPERESIDGIIDETFDYVHVMHKTPAPSNVPEMTNAINLTISEFSDNLNQLRLVLVHFLHNKNQHYRDSESRELRQNFHELVKKYRALSLAVTPQTRRIDLMIQATCELTTWLSQENTRARKSCYFNVQSALAARIQERLETMKGALFRIETNQNSREFSSLVSKVHELAIYFHAVNFPSNDFTDKLIDSFQVLFRRLNFSAMVRNGKPTIIPFERIRSWRMREKLESTRNYLRNLDRKQVFPPEVYWKLLQVKVDIRHWMFEMSGWPDKNSTDSRSLRLQCDEAIKEVNRLKRMMDRLPLPEVLKRC